MDQKQHCNYIVLFLKRGGFKNGNLGVRLTLRPVFIFADYLTPIRMMEDGAGEAELFNRDSDPPMPGHPNLNDILKNPDLPLEWDACSSCASGCNTPKTHTGRCIVNSQQLPILHLVPVKRGSDEWDKASGPYTTRGWTVLAVTRVQNSLSHQLFEEGRQADLRSAKKYTVKEGLFHVSKAPDLDNLLMEGLDQRLSNGGRFGRGIYLSDRPDKADSYWPAGGRKGCGWDKPHGAADSAVQGGEVRTMLRCRARLGNPLVFVPGYCNSGLQREPCGYDSVEGNLTGQDEFIVYDNARVLIEHVVQYVVPTTELDEREPTVLGPIPACTPPSLKTGAPAARTKFSKHSNARRALELGGSPPEKRHKTFR